MTDASQEAARVHEAIGRLRQQAEHAGATAVETDLGRMSGAAQTLRDLLGTRSERLAEGTNADDLRAFRHDLRTPVNQILGYCELVAEETRDQGDSRWTPALEDIATQTRVVLTAIDGIGSHLTAAGAGGSPPREPGAPSPVSSHSGAGWRALSRPIRVATEQQPAGTILVVDDNRENRELLERRLRRDGFSVVTAEHGAQALESLAAQAIDVVLLDIMMPVMDGYQTLERLKSDPELCHLPVIMLSSLDEPQSISRCIERGAEDHLPKPFDPVLLRARIGASLDKKRARDLERAYLDRIVAEKQRADNLLHGVIPLGVALSAERDLNRLLERVLQQARHFCGADGGVLFLRKQDRLEHVLLQCDSIVGAPDDSAQAPDMPSLDLHDPRDQQRPAAKAARGETVNLADVRGEHSVDTSAARAFDAHHGYQTRSLIALPLRGVANDVVGVLQLWNATRANDGEAVAFDRGMVDVLQSLSSLAGAALQSYRDKTELRQRIRHLEIRVDEANRRHEVSQITETDYFRKLRDMAHKIRATADPHRDP